MSRRRPLLLYLALHHPSAALLTKLAVVLVVIEAVTLIVLGVWLGLDGAPTSSQSTSSAWPKTFASVAIGIFVLGLPGAAWAVGPLVVVVLWAGGTFDTSRQTSRRGRPAVAFLGAAVHLGFTVVFWAETLFPSEYRGATFAPAWIFLGQGALTLIVWLTALATPREPLIFTMTSEPGPIWPTSPSPPTPRRPTWPSDAPYR